LRDEPCEARNRLQGDQAFPGSTGFKIMISLRGLAMLGSHLKWCSYKNRPQDD